MLHISPNEALELSFSRWVWGGTPPDPLETEPERGRSSLRYPQHFENLSQVVLENGGHADLSRYPTLEVRV